MKGVLTFVCHWLKESYPNPPPMWFAESEDAKITEIVESLSCIEPTAPNLVRLFCSYTVKRSFSVKFFEIQLVIGLNNGHFTFIYFFAASSLYKALGQGTIQMAKFSYTIAHRKPRFGTAYTRKFILFLFFVSEAVHSRYCRSSACFILDATHNITADSRLLFLFHV